MVGNFNGERRMNRGFIKVVSWILIGILQLVSWWITVVNINILVDWNFVVTVVWFVWLLVGLVIVVLLVIIGFFTVLKEFWKEAGLAS